MRDGGYGLTVLAVLNRLSSDVDTVHFTRYMIDSFLPLAEQLKLTVTPLTDNDYNTSLYFDIVQGLFSFLFVEEEFTADFDE